jgi:hypothetical protein
VIGADAHGATGAAVGFVAGTLLRLGIQTAVSAVATPGLHRLVPPRQLLGWIVATGSAFAVARLIDDAVDPTLAGVFLAGAAGSVVYIGGVALLAGALPRDQERISRLLKRRKPRDND